MSTFKALNRMSPEPRDARATTAMSHPGLSCCIELATPWPAQIRSGAAHSQQPDGRALQPIRHTAIGPTVADPTARCPRSAARLPARLHASGGSAHASVAARRLRLQRTRVESVSKREMIERCPTPRTSALRRVARGPPAWRPWRRYPDRGRDRCKTWHSSRSACPSAEPARIPARSRPPCRSRF